MIHEVHANGYAKEEELSNESKTSNTHLTNSLDKFINNKSSDVLCLAYAIRNLYAHGEFTGGGSGVTNNKTRQIYFELANEILDYSEKLYSQCLEKIKLRR
jgi:hypothetical protein